MAPSAAPVGIVPGTAIGDAVGMLRVRIAAAFRVEVDPPCAKDESQPNRTMAAAVMRNNRRIGVSRV
jgi:hypothetical protein